MGFVELQGSRGAMSYSGSVVFDFLAIVWRGMEHGMAVFGVRRMELGSGSPRNNACLLIRTSPLIMHSSGVHILS